MTATVGASRRLVLITLVVLAGSAAVTVVTASTGGGTHGPAAQSTPANNTSVHHEHPDRVGESGDTGRLLGWLSGRLTGGLEGSLLELSQGQYDRAKGFIGAEWRQRLGQYVDVAGETDEESDDETGETVAETGSNQREYVERVQAFREAVDAYETARDNNDTAAARRAARRAGRIADQIARLNRSLSADYRSLGNLTDQPVRTELQLVATISANVTAEQQTIQTETFVRTTLTVSTNRTRISFLRPVRVSGRLETANGSAIANSDVRLRVGRKTRQVRTDAGGRFSTAYRPVGLSVASERLVVRFVPGETAQYRTATADAPIDVRQVEPAVATTVDGDAFRYGDPVAATVTVSVADHSIQGVPIRVATGGVAIGNATTGADGTATVSRSLPASVPAGRQPITGEVTWADRAIGAGSSARTIDVQASATALQFSADVEAAAVRVAGRLATADGTPVRSQAVRLRLAGESVATVRTTASGSFAAQLQTASLRAAVGAGNATLAAAFDGTGTNLETARNTTQVVIPAGAGGDGGQDADTWPGSTQLIVGLVLLCIVGGVGIAGRWYLANRGSEPAGGAGRQRPGQDGGPDERAAQTGAGSPGEFLLERARSLFENDRANDQTVGDAYAAMREHLHQSLGLPRQLTHREFLGACSEQLDAAAFEDVSRVAAAYEGVVFGASVSEGEARAALGAAESVLSRRSEEG